jgi:hypothetical protein
LEEEDRKWAKWLGLERNAATRDVPTKLRREEFVARMAPRQRNAAMRDAPTKFRREEYVSRMAQS